jgi:hypothetical protein
MVAPSARIWRPLQLAGGTIGRGSGRAPSIFSRRIATV